MTALLTDEAVDRAGEEFARDGAEDNLGSVAENKYAFIRGALFARSIYEARLAEDAKVRAGLVEALRKLCAEVSATLGTIEAEMREAAGNTNVNALTLRWEEAKAALAAAKVLE